ncbi:MAG: hypothetical protein J6Z31_02225 [Fibrobacter sp.]|nr:hypothetical protein [Fibrobacter sp.]
MPWLVGILACGTALAAPDFSMVGFATLGGGTTGGAGGAVVEVSNFSDFKRYAEELETPYVIIVNGEINTGIKTYIDSDGAVASSGTETTYGEIVLVGNNKTIVGKGSNGFLNRVGLNIQKKHNIIIRNIKFTMSDVPISKTDENKVIAFRNGAEVLLNDPDCISIQADSGDVAKADQASYNIWIDHCEFYNAYTDNKDRYDGLLDAKNNIYNTTISWNYFHDHHKGSLIGNSNSDDFRHEITFHHNYYKDIDARTPMMRYNNSHLYNNYLEGQGAGNGPNVRKGSDLYFEKNHYAGLSKAIFAGDDGVATIVDNYYEGCGNMMSSGCNSKKMKISVNPGTSLSANDTVWVTYSDEIQKGSFNPSNYYRYTADAVGNVKALVTAYSGIGKIDISEYESGTVIVPEDESSSSVEEESSSSYVEESSSSEDREGIINVSNVPQVHFYVEGNRITFSAPAGERVQVFSVAGKLLAETVAQSGETTLQLNVPNGRYLFKAGQNFYRFTIR